VVEGHPTSSLNLRAVVVDTEHATCIPTRLRNQASSYCTPKPHLTHRYNLYYYNNMSEAAKPDPAADQVANPGATLVKDETAKVTTDKASDKATTESKDDKPLAEKATEAAAAVKDNVFSMFGGGPAKVKKEEADDVDEPSGASKPKGEVLALINYV